MDVNPIDLLIGLAVMPPLIAVLNQCRWSPPVKGVSALVACLLVALGMEFLRGPLAVSGWRDTAMVVAASAFASYKVWWRPSGIAPALEDATSLPADDNGGQHQAEPE